MLIISYSIEFNIFEIVALKASNFWAALFSFLLFTYIYNFIFGSVPEGLKAYQELSSNINFKTLDFGILVLLDSEIFQL